MLAWFASGLLGVHFMAYAVHFHETDVWTSGSNAAFIHVFYGQVLSIYLYTLVWTLMLVCERPLCCSASCAFILVGGSDTHVW